MTTPVDNCARFAACPLTVGGTSTRDWLPTVTRLPQIDLSGCDEIVVVAAHPDDETFGFGAAAGTLAAGGVRVRVVVVSDGGASHPGRRHLADTRRRELDAAAEVLGVEAPVWLGFPDGELRSHEHGIADALTCHLHAGAWCAATWRGDGHPDHEATGRAAAIAATRTGSTLVEYPLWMWHWAVPGDPAVPWDRMRAVPATDAARGQKSTAAQCYSSQLEDPPVLPPFVVGRLLDVGEVVFV